jgi:Tfp pilus assembly protein PilO
MKSQADAGSTEIISKTKLADYYKNIKNLSIVSSEDRAQLDGMLVDYSDAVEFIEQIEKTADQIGVKLDIGNLAEEKKDDKASLPLIGKLDFTVNVTGSWDRVTRFALAIESLPYKITVNDLQISRTGSEIGSGKAPSVWRGGLSFSVLTRNK